MKPHNAMEMTTPIDLSTTALAEAFRMSGTATGSRWWHVIYLPSQLLDIGAILALDFNCALSLSIDYHPDEWSLHAMRWTATKLEQRIVWSPGA